MKLNPWTFGLIGAGLVSLPAVTQADEKASSLMTAVTPTTLSGYVDTSAQWNFGTGNEALPPYAFGGPAQAHGVNFAAVQLSRERYVEPSAGWGAGYLVD